MAFLSIMTGLAPGLQKSIVYLVICIYLCHLSTGKPVGDPQIVNFTSCLTISKRLLEEVKETLTIPNVTRGFNCSADTEMELQDITKNQTTTPWTCAPTPAPMSHGGQEGDKTCGPNSIQCLQNITSDLQIYEKKLQDFSHITSNLSKSIKQLLEAINPDDNSASNSEGKKEERSDDTFSQRMELCKLLHALKLRTITINRVMNHRKGNQP